MANTQKTDITEALKVLLFFFVSCLLLYFGKAVFIPMLYGLFIAMVMYPVSKRLEQRGMPRSVAVTLVLSFVVALFAALVMLLVWQLSLFKEDLPGLKEKLLPLLASISTWFTESTGVIVPSPDTWAQQLFDGGLGTVGTTLSGTFATTITTLFWMFLVPIYAALFLYNRGMFVRALYAFAGEARREKLDKVLQQTIHTYFNYIKGLVLVYIIVGILNSLGLLALGIKHAVLFGMLTAIMTIIPYVGIVVSASLPISVALITKDSAWYAVGVVGVFSFVQYLEANVIFPRVVGAQLNVSTWATLVAIIAGGIIWGVSGMILFIPFVAIMKIATDYTESWKPLNILLSR